ncbi:hypothetical protein [Hyphococcus sp. DH-69]|uniref:hypothetical protein n=1 Tax=Hyphococcus formosus TaxID=3143534 RepID=UPI00398B5D2B
MSVVEKAGSNILKTSFGKKNKKKKKDRDQVTEQVTNSDIANVGPEKLELDFEELAKNGFYNNNDRSTQLALELRAVKRRLLRRIGYLRASGERQAYRTPGKQRNLILVTSTRAGEGKTFSAINIALSLALEDNIETLLIDADLARPKVRDRLGLPHLPGLSDRLSNPRLNVNDMGWRLNNGPLSILPEGARSERPTDLFGSPEAQRLWTEVAMEKSDRLIILDAPPVLAATDAVVLAKYVDEIVFVVEANSTPEPAVAAAIDELVEINPNISVMLNRCQIGAGGAHYGSYEYYERADSEESLATAKQSDKG